jgi:hypothetical protein
VTFVAAATSDLDQILPAPLQGFERFDDLFVGRAAVFSEECVLFFFDVEWPATRVMDVSRSAFPCPGRKVQLFFCFPGWTAFGSL